MSLLRAESVWKSFGGVQAVSGVDFEVRPGELACIIGPNGAGKTTFFNLITGYCRPDRGRVIFDGHDITGLPPHRTARVGLVRSFQKTHVFSEMTVAENIRTMVLFRKHRSLNFLATASRLEREESEAVLNMVGLTASMRAVAGTLSAGDRKRLELGITLAAAPKLLLLDEPTCGMSPTETASTIELIQRLNQQQKLTLLFTEHKMDVVFAVAERIAVLHFGRLIAEGKPGEIRANEEVRRIYLGEPS